ncbi:MAG: hypothetical protein ACE144_19715 [Thermodesulfobacteriota bacterium]
MDLKGTLFRLPIFFLLFTFFLVFACSTPSWFPIKKGPPHKAKTKELLDKEVVIVDREEYVKILNPKALDKGDQPKYLYIPVDEYLSKREAFAAPVPAPQKEEVKKEFSVSSPVSPTKPSPSSVEKDVPSRSPSVISPPNLKKKIVIAHFDDQTTLPEERFGDWVAEKLIKEVNRRSQRILFVDYESVKEFLEMKGVALTDLEKSNVLYSLNEVFGIHALVVGQLSGPYVFTTKAAQTQEETASAIIKIETRLVDTLSGKTLKSLSANNPIIAAKDKGPFSDEKAKMKAIDFAISDLSRSLSRELDGLDWFCRVAKVDGEEVYINAGRLTGIKVGDVMEVLQPGERGTVKGKIQISAWFGIDASIGKMIQGQKPDVDDILRIARSIPNSEAPRPLAEGSR